MKSNDNKRKALSDIPAADTWPGYLENLEGECIELSKENQSDFALFPMREKDYDSVRDVSSEEIRKVVRNLKGRSG